MRSKLLDALLRAYRSSVNMDKSRFGLDVLAGDLTYEGLLDHSEFREYIERTGGMVQEKTKAEIVRTVSLSDRMLSAIEKYPELFTEEEKKQIREGNLVHWADR